MMDELAAKGLNQNEFVVALTHAISSDRMNSSEITFRAPRSPLVAQGAMEIHHRDMTGTFTKI